MIRIANLEDIEEIAEGKNIFVNNDHKKYIEEKLR